MSNTSADSVTNGAGVPPQASRDTEPFTPAMTRDMLVVHTAFRREFRLIRGLVDATAPGDVARARVVSDHLALITGFLHHHHTGEDRLLWPTLLERVDHECAPVVLLMEAQHEKVSAQLDAVEELRAAFAVTPGEPERDALSAACERLYALLDEHLRAEETRLLPIAERHLSREEWERMGEEGLGTLPKRQLPLAFGMLSYEGNPETLAEMMAGAPLPIRYLVPPLARRAFKRYALRVHGTATP